jgi:hypothetical protein
MIDISDPFIKDNFSVFPFWIFFLYAEIHYTFKLFFSRFKTNEPEIIADAPHRVEPNTPIPILCLIKDANDYPIKLNTITIELIYNRENIEKKTFNFYGSDIESKWWYKLFEVEPISGFGGNLWINVIFTVQIKGKIKRIYNDNYKLTSHAPLKVHVAHEPIPKFDGLLYGDLHYHSNLTADQVEFGAPIEESAKMAKAMGFGFLCLTDHSYDIDDIIDNPLKNDPEIPKWKEMHSVAKSYKDFIVIPGEEVSCGNHYRMNVHMLMLNNKEFIRGSGDSAERWFRTTPEHSVKEILSEIEPNAVAFAAHPEERPPLLQKVLLRRGKWGWKDYIQVNLSGLEVLNGAINDSFHSGIHEWVNLILQGKKLSIVAGTDAHGNFNRFRQIGFPFFTMREHENQIFGKTRTGVFVDDEPTKEKIISSLRNGNCIITDGAIAKIIAKDEKDKIYQMGDEIHNNIRSISVHVKSTIEYGKLKDIKLIIGDVANGKEEILMNISGSAIKERYDDEYSFEDNIQINNTPDFCYIRAELKSEKSVCLTNPIWVRKN